MIFPHTVLLSLGLASPPQRAKPVEPAPSRPRMGWLSPTPLIAHLSRSLESTHHPALRDVKSCLTDDLSPYRTFLLRPCGESYHCLFLASPLFLGLASPPQRAKPVEPAPSRPRMGWLSPTPLIAQPSCSLGSTHHPALRDVKSCLTDDLSTYRTSISGACVAPSTCQAR
jgi:hypothetical protein